MDDRIVSSGFRQGDDEQEQSLRPKTLREYIGQESVKQNLHISIEAALKRRESLDHILLYGPPGLGKTTLAGIIAAEMGQNIRITSGPAIERPGDLASILTNLADGDVLFIDEIHRLSRSVEEVLYPAMEDYALENDEELALEYDQTPGANGGTDVNARLTVSVEEENLIDLTLNADGLPGETDTQAVGKLNFAVSGSAVEETASFLSRIVSIRRWFPPSRRRCRNPRRRRWGRFDPGSPPPPRRRSSCPRCAVPVR